MPAPLRGNTRIEKAALELQMIRDEISVLEAKKKQLGDRILLMLQNEGTPDEDGKIRLETEYTRFSIIDTVRQTCNVEQLGVALLGQGLTPLQIGKVKQACVKETRVRYAGVYPKPQAVDETVEAAS